MKRYIVNDLFELIEVDWWVTFKLTHPTKTVFIMDKLQRL